MSFLEACVACGFINMAKDKLIEMIMFIQKNLMQTHLGYYFEAVKTLSWIFVF